MDMATPVEQVEITPEDSRAIELIERIEKKKAEKEQRKQHTEDIRRYLEIIKGDSEVLEIRALGVPWGRGNGRSNKSIYFKDPAIAAELAAKVEDEKPVGLYVTMNPIEPATFARAPHVIIENRDGCTKDKEILRRRWLLIDCDPDRPVKDVPATDDEKHAAGVLAKKVFMYLKESGWPTPLIGDSGNGFLLLYRVNLANDDETTELIGRIYAALNDKLACVGSGEKSATVDGANKNAARITRLLGTWNRKSYGDQERPHRQSAILSNDISQPFEVVPIEKMQEIAALAPNPVQPTATPTGMASPPSGANNGYKHRLKLREYLQDRPVQILSEKIESNGTHKFVVVCPFDATHSRGEVAFFQYPSGGTHFNCMHDSCQGNRWKEAKALLGEPTDDEYDPPKTRKQKKPKPSDPELIPVPAVANTLTFPVGETEITIPLTFDRIMVRMRETFGEWPARVANHLFVDTGNGIEPLETPNKLFGWMRGGDRIIKWDGGGDRISTSQFHAELSRTAKRYIAVEDWPHEPPLAGHYYTKRELPAPTGKAVERFLDFFAPDTPTDRDLILAMMMTLFWGNRGGSRPCFTITSETGRGVGKSSLVSMIGMIAGGFQAFDANEDPQRMKERLLTPSAFTNRLALIDNIKSLSFSWPELESLITTPVISGRQLYVGDASRPNTVTWALTLNNANLSRDMAQRSVVIRLKRPSADPGWEGNIVDFIEANQLAIVSDLLARIRTPANPLPSYSRWAKWEGAVLTKVNDPLSAQQLIAARQAECDTDNQSMESIEDGFARRLKYLGFDPTHNKIHIPNYLAARWYGDIKRAKLDEDKALKALKGLVTENKEKNWIISNNPSNKNGRGFIWNAKDGTGCVDYSIEEKIKYKGLHDWTF
jgi:hypothetical protein